MMSYPAAIWEASDLIALMSYSTPSIARLIDHTLLRPEATRADILQLCAEAREYNFASVCLNAYWVPLAASQLTGTGVKVCTVVGFPLGATSTESKVAENQRGMCAGGGERDTTQREYVRVWGG